MASGLGLGVFLSNKGISSGGNQSSSMRSQRSQAYVLMEQNLKKIVKIRQLYHVKSLEGHTQTFSDYVEVASVTLLRGMSICVRIVTPLNESKTYLLEDNNHWSKGDTCGN